MDDSEISKYKKKLFCNYSEPRPIHSQNRPTSRAFYVIRRDPLCGKIPYYLPFLLIYGAVTLFEPPYELDNQPLTCKHDDSDYLILRGSE